jgi:hypothetical protein
MGNDLTPENEVVTKVSFWCSDLYKKTFAEFKALFSTISPRATTLELTGNELYLKRGELAAVLALTPANITYLNLGGNSLYKNTTTVLAAVFKTLPPTLLSLNLEYNGLGNKISTELATALSEIQGNVTTLILANNKLDLLKGGLKAVLSAIPKSISTLDIGGNDLHKVDNLATVLAAIPPEVTTLDLSNNALFKMSTLDLASAIQSISKGITHLKLGKNNLYLKSSADLTTLCSAIPEHVKKLDLSFNDFSKKNTKDLAIVLAGIPAHITEITLSLSDIDQRSHEDLISLGRALPHVLKIQVLGKDNNPAAHNSVDVLRNHIGEWFIESYKRLINVESISYFLNELALEVLSNLVDAHELKSFLQYRLKPYAKNNIGPAIERMKPLDNDHSSYNSSFFPQPSLEEEEVTQKLVTQALPQYS